MKAQEEMIGFVMIILIVVVVGVILLGIGLNKPKESKTSLEITDFLYTLFQYSVNCSDTYKDLIISCIKNEYCNSISSCQALEDITLKVINTSLRVGSEKQYKAYEYKIFSGNSSVIYLTSGETTRNSVGSNVKIITSEDKINVSLKLYY